MTALAMVLAAVAAWLLVPAPGLAIRRLAVAPVAAPGRREVGWALGGAGAVVVLWLVLGGRVGAPAAVLGLVGGTAARVATSHLAARHALRERRDVAQACAAVAAEVGAGRAPAAAVGEVAREWPVLAPGAGQLALGGDPVPLWRRDAERPGCAGLATLAAAWQVSTVTGAPLGPALDAVAEALREDRVLAQTVAQELAAARATGRLMAGLPLVGLLLGYGLGGDPVGFLLGQPWGRACLVLGVALACAGLLWSERLADRAQRW